MFFVDGMKSICKQFIYDIKDNSRVVAGLVIAFFQFFYYLGCDYIGVEHADTVSYVYHSFAISDLDARPPIYPFILKLCGMLVGESRYYFLVCLIQIFVSVISVVFFFKICCAAFEKEWLAVVITVFYGCNPAMLYWNTAIMTEALSISMSVFFLYNIAKYAINPKDNALNGILMSIISLVATMIKPSLVIYLGICGVLLILQFFMDKNNRPILLKVFISFVICFAVVMGYCGLEYKYNGVFNVSTLGPRHELINCLATGTYKNYPDKELVSQIDAYLEEGGGEWEEHSISTKIMAIFGEDRPTQARMTKEFAAYCDKSDPSARYRFVFENVKNSFLNEGYDLGWIYHKKANVLVNVIAKLQMYIFGIIENRLAWLFVVPVLMLISTVILWIRNRNCPWLFLGILGVTVATIIVNYLGDYGSFIRITIYVLPFIYFGIGLEISQCCSTRSCDS